MNKQKILVISGRKQAGKNTVASFVRGMVLLQAELVDEFEVSEATLGELRIKRRRTSDDVNLHKNNYLISNYEFADKLKLVMKEMFGLTSSQVDGTNGDKDVLTDFVWENMPGLSETEFAKRTGRMTARQLTQFVGGNLLRNMDPDIHIKRTYEQIEKDGAAISTIVGARYENEVLFRPTSFSADVKTIRLARTLYPEDNHSSETSLDPSSFSWYNFDAVVWNQNMTIEQTCAAMLSWLRIWNWVK